jgi:hypothetical protein
METKLNTLQVELLKMLGELSLIDYHILYFTQFRWYIEVVLKKDDSISMEIINNWIAELLSSGYIEVPQGVYGTAPVTIHSNLRIAQKGRKYLAELPMDKTDKIEKKKYTIPEYGILHVFYKKHGGKPVTEQNKKDLAAEYGYTAPSSGKQLLDQYRKFNIGTQDVSDKKQLQRMLNILPELEKRLPAAVEDVRKEIGTLQKKLAK